jgi:predicted nucleic-acid-binding protein
LIGIDTNVLVRFLTLHDAEQAALAVGLIDTLTAQDPAFISRQVLIQTVWVLERAYGFDRMTIAKALDAVLEAEELLVENPDVSAWRCRVIVTAGRDLPTR